MHELLPWLRLIGQRQRRLLVGALLLALTLLAGLALLALSGWFITASAAAGLLLAAGTAVAFDIYVPGAGIRLFAITRTAARYGERVYNHDTVLRLLADLRVRLFRGLSSSNPASRASQRGSNWLSRLTNDLDNLDTLYLRLIAPTGLALLLTGGFILMLARFYSELLGLVIGALLGLALLLGTWAVHASTRDLCRQRVEKLEWLRGQCIEHLEAQAELTAAGLNNRNQGHLLAGAQQLSQEQTSIDQRIGRLAAMSGFLVNAAAVAGLWFGIALLQTGQVSGPVLALLPLAVLGFTEIYSVLPDGFGRLGGTIAAATRLNQDMAGQTGAARESGNALHPGSPPEPAIYWQNASRNHPGLPPEVRAWTLRVDQGERVGIVGASGRGKSTLADMAAGLIEPSSGYCWRGGQPGKQPDWQSWRGQISYLTQNTELLDDTLRNNLLLGHPEASETDLWGILETVCLADLVASMPKGLDAWLGAYGQQVSGGEARRIALARALLKPANLIILDEPFTGLDPGTRNEIRARINRRLNGKTLVAFAHSTRALPTVDRQKEI